MCHIFPYCIWWLKASCIYRPGGGLSLTPFFRLHCVGKIPGLSLWHRKEHLPPSFCASSLMSSICTRKNWSLNTCQTQTGNSIELQSSEKKHSSTTSFPVHPELGYLEYIHVYGKYPSFSVKCLTFMCGKTDNTNSFDSSEGLFLVNFLFLVNPQIHTEFVYYKAL